MLYTNLKIMLDEPCHVKIIHKHTKTVKLNDVVKTIVLTLEVGDYKIKVKNRKIFEITLKENQCEIIK